MIYKYSKDKYVKPRIQTEREQMKQEIVIEEIKHNDLMSEK